MKTEITTLDWEALEVAVERNSAVSESYLNRRSGRVVTVTRGQPDAASLQSQISSEIDSYLRIEPASCKDQYRWMERFACSVSEVPLRERLLISIDGKGAFRRFKDVLSAYPVERERWFAHRSAQLRWYIQNWLEGHDIETKGAPWGIVEKPIELEVVESATSRVKDLPGESLRRTARALVDQIPAIDIPSAIAFLEFLRERAQTDASARTETVARPGIHVVSSN